MPRSWLVTALLGHPWDIRALAESGGGLLEPVHRHHHGDGPLVTHDEGMLAG